MSSNSLRYLICAVIALVGACQVNAQSNNDRFDATVNLQFDQAKRASRQKSTGSSPSIWGIASTAAFGWVKFNYSEHARNSQRCCGGAQKHSCPVVRWPGGCFADEYHWRNGIGPKEQRPKMINTHWVEWWKTTLLALTNLWILRADRR